MTRLDLQKQGTNRTGCKSRHLSSETSKPNHIFFCDMLTFELDTRDSPIFPDPDISSPHSNPFSKHIKHGQACNGQRTIKMFRRNEDHNSGICWQGRAQTTSTLHYPKTTMEPKLKMLKTVIAPCSATSTEYSSPDSPSSNADSGDIFVHTLYRSALLEDTSLRTGKGLMGDLTLDLFFSRRKSRTTYTKMVPALRSPNRKVRCTWTSLLRKVRRGWGLRKLERAMSSDVLRTCLAKRATKISRLGRHELGWPSLHFPQRADFEHRLGRDNGR
jgi:hypothetical protein